MKKKLYEEPKVEELSMTGQSIICQSANINSAGNFQENEFELL